MARRTQQEENYDDGVIYYPKYAENAEDEDPFWFRIHPMKAKEWERAQEKGANFSIGRRRKVNALKSAHEVRDDIIAKRVTDGGGYYWTPKGGAEIEVTDGATLVRACKNNRNAAEVDLLDELLDAITDRSILDEGLKKKSKESHEPLEPMIAKFSGGDVKSSAANRKPQTLTGGNGSVGKHETVEAIRNEQTSISTGPLR